MLPPAGRLHLIISLCCKFSCTKTASVGGSPDPPTSSLNCREHGTTLHTPRHVMAPKTGAMRGSPDPLSMAKGNDTSAERLPEGRRIEWQGQEPPGGVGRPLHRALGPPGSFYTTKHIFPARFANSSPSQSVQFFTFVSQLK